MASYRCDLCCHRKRTKWGADLCNNHNKVVPSDAIEPPDFCYVWQFYENKARIRWYKKGKLIEDGNR